MNILAHTVIVNNQKEFDVISKMIGECLANTPETLRIVIQPGRYYFSEDQLQLQNYQFPNKTLIIEGRGVSVLARGKDYCDNDKYDGSFSVYRVFVDTNGKDVEFWNKVCYYNGLIEVVDEKEGLCRLKCKDLPDLDESTLKHAFIKIPKWYLSGAYKLTKVSDGYIYFVSKFLRKSNYGGWNINNDYNYGRQPIRYFLCNINSSENKEKTLDIVNGRIKIPKGIGKVHESMSCRFVYFSHISLKKLIITGISFQGNALHSNSSLIDFIDTRVNDSLTIRNCSFQSIKSQVINAVNTNNLIVDSCEFKDIFGNCVSSDNSSFCTCVTNCIFRNLGKDMMNTFAVICKGSNYHVANNTICDFGYGAVAVGVYYGKNCDNLSYGIIEDNTIFYTDEYAQDLSSKLMDSGAIYLWTKNNGAIIRYNYIHDISGVKDNRGIFCDDGARNFQIYGNVIIGIANSYAIDSRRVTFMESDIGPTNVNNIVRDNIIDGCIRFQCKDCNDNGCMFGDNYCLMQGDKKDITKRLSTNIVGNGDLIRLDYIGRRKNTYKLSRRSINRLKASREWKRLKWFVN